ncbi:MAG: PIN domain-containing protein [Tunicatimonas sp.]
MKLFIDANVLISVLNKEYFLFTYSSRVLSLAQRANYELMTSPLCLAIAFYFSAKKHNETVAKVKIDRLTIFLGITEMNEKIVKKALQDKRAHDFEDGMQYYSATEAGCTVIVTDFSLRVAPLALKILSGRLIFNGL